MNKNLNHHDYNFAHLNRELYHFLDDLEHGLARAPYMIQILLPFTCTLGCLFCGSQPFKECKHAGYSEVLGFIEKIYFESLRINDSRSLALRKIVSKSLAELKQIGIKANIGADLIEIIDSIANDTKLVSVMYFPYVILARLKSKLARLRVSQQVVITAYITRWVAKILAEQCLDFKTDLKYYLSVIKEAGEMGSKVISLGGFSDMFDAPDYLLPIMEQVKSADMHGVMHTSGFIVNEDLMGAMVDLSWDEIVLSLHTTDPATAAIMRGSSKYIDQVNRFMLTLNEIKKQKNTNLPQVNCVNVLNKYNYKEFADVVQWAADHEINKLYFHPMWLYSKDAFDIKMEKSEVEDFKQLIINNADRLSSLNIDTNARDFLSFRNMHLATMYSDPPSLKAVERHLKNYARPSEPICSNDTYGPLDKAVCPAPWFQIAIDNQGGIKLCAQHTNAPFSGNIHTHALADIWFGDEFRLARKNYLEGKLPIDCTRYCSRYPSIYDRQLLAEYLQYKKFRDETIKLPDPIGSLLRNMGKVKEGGFVGKRLLPWLMKAGFRLSDPW